MGIFRRPKKEEGPCGLELECIISGAVVRAVGAKSEADAAAYVRIIHKYAPKEERYGLSADIAARRMYDNTVKEAMERGAPLHGIVSEHVKRYLEAYNGLIDHNEVKKRILSINEAQGVSALKGIVQKISMEGFSKDDVSRYEEIRGALRDNLGYDPNLDIEGTDETLDEIFYRLSMTGIGRWIAVNIICKGKGVLDDEVRSKYLAAMVDIERCAAGYLRSVKDENRDSARKMVEYNMRRINDDAAENCGFDIIRYHEGLYTKMQDSSIDSHGARELFAEYAALGIGLPLLMGLSKEDIDRTKSEMERKFGNGGTFDYTVKVDSL